MTQREIAKHVGLSQKAVHSIKTRLDFSNTSSPKCSSCGRKSSFTPHTERILLRECRNNKKLTSKQLQNTLLDHHIKVSSSCVRRPHQSWYVCPPTPQKAFTEQSTVEKTNELG